MTETPTLAELKAARDAAHEAAAAADLAYGNAVNAAQRDAEIRQLNIELAQRNPRRRYEMVQSGVLTEEDLTHG